MRLTNILNISLLVFLLGGLVVPRPPDAEEGDGGRQTSEADHDGADDSSEFRRDPQELHQRGGLVVQLGVSFEPNHRIEKGLKTVQQPLQK